MSQPPALPRLLLTLLSFVCISGCAIHPEGELEERERAELVMKVQDVELPDRPSIDNYLQYAFFHNADLESRYWEWRMAIEQIPQDASPPNLALSFDYMFSAGNMKAWDRTSLGATNDPMANIPWPSKLETAGQRALEQARAAGARFESAKFLLQGKVFTTYFDLALLAESMRIGEENIALLQLILNQAAIRLQSGGSQQQDLLQAQTELDLARNDLENQRARVGPLSARFNVLLGRQADAVVPLPESLPSPRPLPVGDSELIQIAAERSPELRALANHIAGQEQSLRLAQQAYIPDFSLNIGFTGSVSQTLGGIVTLPLRRDAISAGVKQAQDGMRLAEAARTQYERSLSASFILNLTVLRNDERQISLFENTIIPRARQTVDIAQAAYATSRIDFGELIRAQRTLIEATLTTAQLKMEREKALVAIETWSAVDVEVMGGR